MSNREFIETKHLFQNYLGTVQNLSYELWCALDEDMKVPALYLNFYSQISLAWSNASYGCFYANDADCVDLVIQYLTKNVERIKTDKQRYTPGYIYRIMYNCIYCECHDLNPARRKYENECSMYATTDKGDEVSLLDFVGMPSFESQMESDAIAKEFWRIVEEESSDELIEFYDRLIGQDAPYKKINKICSDGRVKQVAAIKMTDALRQSCLEEAREKLKYVAAKLYGYEF